MAGTYSPAANASWSPFLTTVFLSQRDLAIQVPLNYVTRAGVSLAATCFSQDRFVADEATTCISNLLALGYSRFILDLYWDSNRQLWSFCPASIPIVTPNSSYNATSRPTLSTNSSRSAERTPTGLVDTTTSNTQSVNSVTVSQSLEKRVTTASPTGSALFAGETESVAIPASAASPQNVTRIGPYTCTSSTDATLFFDILLGFLRDSDDTINAHLIYLIANLHAAAEAATPEKPAAEVDTGSHPISSLQKYFPADLGQFIYTPVALQHDRGNLNASWYDAASSLQPDASYYKTSAKPGPQGNISYTSDGWPSEGYVEFSKRKRLLFGWGTLDPQVQGYNFSADQDTIFPSGYLQVQDLISASDAGDVKTGCFYKSGDTLLSQANSSWAVTSQVDGFNFPTTSSASLGPTKNLAMSVTNCGYSLILNQTILNVTAAENFTPYAEILHNTIWSWASDEPRNTSSKNDADFRCAAMSSRLNGHWEVHDCGDRLYAACRLKTSPYTWSISSDSMSYSSSPDACPRNSTFSVPQTALENAYLYAQLRSDPRLARDRSSSSADGTRIWMDFNSLDAAGCWVTGGANATCPYQEDSAVARRSVLVPTIAAIIVLLIALLTLFAKGRTHRKSSRRRRKRVAEGWEYEGVPS